MRWSSAPEAALVAVFTHQSAVAVVATAAGDGGQIGIAGAVVEAHFQRGRTGRHLHGEHLGFPRRQRDRRCSPANPRRRAKSVRGDPTLRSVPADGPLPKVEASGGKFPSPSTAM